MFLLSLTPAHGNVHWTSVGGLHQINPNAYSGYLENINSALMNLEFLQVCTMRQKSEGFMKLADPLKFPTLWNRVFLRELETFPSSFKSVPFAPQGLKF